MSTRAVLLPVALIAAASLAAYLLVTQKRAEAAFPGQNGRIAFSSYRDAQNDIFSLPHNSTDLRNTTNDSYIDDSPAFSADGRKIAYDCSRSNGNTGPGVAT